MPYYPKSQYQTGFYSNGEYVFRDTKNPYKGPYYKTSTGKNYIGEAPLKLPSREIILSTSNFNDGFNSSSSNDKIIYTTLPNPLFIDIDQRNLPTFSQTYPTKEDYKKGKMIRYFTKKRNELRYLEISKQTFTSSNIAYDLYEPVQIYWIISGFSKQQVNDYNTLIVRDIEQKRRWYGFSQYLKENYTKYYKNLSS